MKPKPIKTSVITGDIVNSKKVNPNIWLEALQTELDKNGPSPKKWEITRGDSFQVEVKEPEKALRTAIKIKAAIKQIKGIDVRMAIGIGTKDHFADKVSECNGSAFVNSGRKFDALKKENLAVCSEDEEFDEEINPLIQLALIAMNRWTVKSAEAVKIRLEHPDDLQEELGKWLKREKDEKYEQNAVSGRLKRAYYAEIAVVLKIYEKQIKHLL